MIELKDEDILLRLRNFEDAFVERKTSGDSSDWLSAAVAFANSAPIDFPAILFIGVKNDGTVEDTVNLDSLQKTFNKKLLSAYPPIYYLPKVLTHEGKQFLAVIIPGSAQRPHFAGQAYVRVGSETKVASEALFAELIAQRTSKARALLEWKDRIVTVVTINTEGLRAVGREASRDSATVENCNEFYVTLQYFNRTDHVSLGRVDITFDEQKKCLLLEIYPLALR